MYIVGDTMNQEIEIEFKNLLTIDEYNKLSTIYSSQLCKKQKQTNYYFDDSRMSLKEHGCALRIREKSGEYYLTFKEPHHDGLLETHQKLTNTEKDEAIKLGKIPSGDVLNQVQNKLKSMKTEFVLLGELTTFRMEGNVEGGLLVLDESHYLHMIDYELEFECNDVHLGKKAFDKLLETHNIRSRHTPNKIRRFFELKMKLERKNT